jgi:hypothetical protein
MADVTGWPEDLRIDQAADEVQLDISVIPCTRATRRMYDGTVGTARTSVAI